MISLLKLCIGSSRVREELKYQNVKEKGATIVKTSDESLNKILHFRDPEKKDGSYKLLRGRRT